MAGKKGMAHYRSAVKEQAIRMALEQGLTYPEITAALGLRDPGRVKAWMRAYRREGWAAFTKPQGRPRQAQREQRELERLRMENTLLKKFHTELRQLALAKRNIG
jgi:transposase